MFVRNNLKGEPFENTRRPMGTVVDIGDIRVLYIPFHITREGIHDDMFMYTVEHDIRNDVYFFMGHGVVTEEMREKCGYEFIGTIISASKLPTQQNLTHDHLKAFSKAMYRSSTIERYTADSLEPIKLFIVQPMHGLSDEEIISKRPLLLKYVAKLLKRDPLDIEVIDQVHVDDPYDIDENFTNEVQRRIYRLTRSIRMMTEATHVLIYGDIKNAPGCLVEKRVLDAYHAWRVIDSSSLIDVIDDEDELKTLFPNIKLEKSENLGEDYLRTPWGGSNEDRIEALTLGGDMDEF